MFRLLAFVFWFSLLFGTYVTGNGIGNWIALLAFPGTIIGAWLGARVYHALSDRNFRDLVLALLFLSGAGLVWSGIAPR